MGSHAGERRKSKGGESGGGGGLKAGNGVGGGAGRTRTERMGVNAKRTGGRGVRQRLLGAPHGGEEAGRAAMAGGDGS